MQKSLIGSTKHKLPTPEYGCLHYTLLSVTAVVVYVFSLLWHPFSYHLAFRDLLGLLFFFFTELFIFSSASGTTSVIVVNGSVTYLL